MHAIRSTPLIALSLLAIACSSDPGRNETVNIGDRDVAVRGDKLSDFSGEWEGYLEAFDIAGTDRIHVSLDASGNGSVRFGTAEQPPPMSTDPLDLYPPAPAEPEAAARYHALQAAGDLPVLGYGYTLSQQSLENRRFRFDFQIQESHDAWCALQTPVMSEEPPGYRCVRSVGDPGDRVCSVLDGNELVPVACGGPFDAACGTCTCDAESCHAGQNALNATTRFDGTLEENGTRFVGTLVFAGRAFGSSRVTARLDKVE